MISHFTFFNFRRLSEKAPSPKKDGNGALIKVLADVW
jgi:hypothetical protein